MKLTVEVANALLCAQNKALATQGPRGLNVVPVSSIRVVGDQIWLINYFFKKTLDNILANPSVALVGWSGFEGFQIHAQAKYVEEGPEFEKARAWVAAILPDRVVRGLLILTPEAAYDISPTA